MPKKVTALSLTLLFVMMSVTVAHAGSWRFPVGLAYVSGFSDVKDLYQDNVDAEGYSSKSSGGAPVGMLFQPYYQFDSGFGVGASVGPVMIITGDRTFFDFPIGIDGRYSFLQGKNISPYIRAGVKKHFAAGDYVDHSTPGIYGGFGVEFLRNRRVGLGVEFTADSSTVTFDRKRSDGYFFYTTTGKEDINPSQYMISVSAIF